MVGALVNRNNQKNIINSKAATSCDSQNWDCLGECANQMIRTMFNNDYQKWRTQRETAMGKPGACSQPSSAPTSRPNVVSPTFSINAEAEYKKCLSTPEWYCLGECASQEVRTLFGSFQKWRDEKAIASGQPGACSQTTPLPSPKPSSISSTKTPSPSPTVSKSTDTQRAECASTPEWYCLGECASQDVRRLFQIADKWRNQKTDNNPSKCDPFASPTTKKITPTFSPTSTIIPGTSHVTIDPTPIVTSVLTQKPTSPFPTVTTIAYTSFPIRKPTVIPIHTNTPIPTPIRTSTSTPTHPVATTTPTKIWSTIAPTLTNVDMPTPLPTVFPTGVPIVVPDVPLGGCPSDDQVIRNAGLQNIRFTGNPTFLNWPYLVAEPGHPAEPVSCVKPSVFVVHWNADPLFGPAESTFDVLNGRALSCAFGADENGLLQMNKIYPGGLTQKEACVGGDPNKYTTNVEISGTEFDLFLDSNLNFVNPCNNTALGGSRTEREQYITNTVINGGYAISGLEWCDPKYVNKLSKSAAYVLDLIKWEKEKQFPNLSKIDGHFNLTAGKRDPGERFLRYIQQHAGL